MVDLGLSLLTGIYAEAQQTGAVTNRAQILRRE